jgi:hypothetical protein
MKFRVSKPRPIGKILGFNVYVETGEFKYQINGFRIMGGYLYPPAIRFGKGPNQFYGVALLDETVMKAIYQELQDEHGVKGLRSMELAIEPSLYSDVKGSKFFVEA